MTSDNSEFDCLTLIGVFNDCFLHKHHACLVAGGDEPLYVPAKGGSPAEIIFTKDYFASALHEVAHWCIAGQARRQIRDYGYWYAPDGRTAQQQQQFETVEIKPQALEWVFNSACGHRFRVSSDNLMAGFGASEQFKKDIYGQVLKYCKEGLPNRAAEFACALSQQYGQSTYLSPERFVYIEL